MPGICEGRVVIVTGAGRGIGRGHALEFARQGAKVVVNDLGAEVDGTGSSTGPTGEVVDLIRSTGGEAVANGGNVADPAQAEELVNTAIETYGGLDVVVNNAGILRDSTISNVSEEEWDLVVAVHLKGTFALLKHAIEHWRDLAKAGTPVTGRVINTTSGAGLFGNFGQANYGAAKAGIALLTITAAMEVQHYGVTVNAISPIARTRMTEGLPMMQGSPDDGGFDRYDPANSSPVVAWLASESSGWLTGAVLRVDGGTVWRMQPWEIDEKTMYRTANGQRLEATELDRGMRLAFRTLPGGLEGSTTSR